MHPMGTAISGKVSAAQEKSVHKAQIPMGTGISGKFKKNRKSERYTAHSGHSIQKEEFRMPLPKGTASISKVQEIYEISTIHCAQWDIRHKYIAQRSVLNPRKKDS